MEILLLKKPYEISLSGNPVPFSFAITPYGASQQTQDIRVQVRILVEDVFNSGVFTEAKSQNFYPTSEGLVSIEIQSILDPYLSYYLPAPNLKRPVQAQQQRKRFKINWLLTNAGVVVSGPTDSDIYYIAKSGLSYEQWHPHEFFSQKIIQQKVPLLFPARGEKCGLGEMKYFFWMYPYADSAQQTLTYKVYFSDGTSASTNAPTIFGGKWSIFCAPSGFSQSGLDSLVPDGKTAVKYSLKVATGATTIVEEYFFEIDYRNFYETHQLVYRNSIGGLESIRLRGQIDFAADYDRQLAQKTVPPAWYSNMNLLPLATDESTEELTNYTGDTGWISKEACDKVRDLFLSGEKIELVNGKFLPININVKKAKFYSNNDQLVSTIVEWSPAYSNLYYTPVGYMPITRTCPAVQSFLVRQVSKFKLQIMYSLDSPYDTVEVQIIIGSTTSTYTYKGNAGTVIQTFANPATGSAVNITVKARTVCDPNSTPVDYGSFSTIILSVTGESLPVAVNDNYTINSGFNSAIALSPSPLSNDYDPDGDAIEAIAASGATNAGGTYAINAAGNVTYTPPSSAYTGNDYFDYQIRNVGGSDTATGRVNIAVGNGAVRVYAKLVTLNSFTSNSQYGSYTSGDIYAYFYSNPQGNIPLDVTGLSISLNIDHTTIEKDLGGDPNTTDDYYTQAASGTSTLIYSGLIYESDYDSPTGDEAYTEHDITLNDGTGYVVI